MDQLFYDEARKVLSDIVQEVAVADFKFEFGHNKESFELFNVGKFYYYLFDRRDDTFRYVCPEIATVLGYTPEIFNLKFFLSKIHPEDQATFLKHENRAIAFFKKLPCEKMTKYKVVHDYRIENSDGRYIRILQQVINIHCDADNNILLLIGVHTDISFLKKENSSSLSFIGLDGEPTFTDVDLRQEYQMVNSNFTKREKEIINCLLAGDQTKEIAKRLNISKFTVDTHRRNILAKTDTRNTLELAVKMMSEKLLSL